MKFSILKPIIAEACFAALLYLILPVGIILVTGLKQVFDTIGWGVTILWLFAILYFNLIYFVPGIAALVDLLTDQFVTSKMTFIESYIDRTRIFAPTDSKKHTVRYYYFTVVLADHIKKRVLSTTRFPLAEEGKVYTVTYGKHSHVVVSIQDADGQELLTSFVE